jgi:serine/threonine-protein kinase
MATFGKYSVVEQIGEGGFGKVYRGWDPVLKRPVAIKTCSFDDPNLRARFVREAEIAASLRHPNIVTVHDFGEEHGEPYLVQEFLEGEDLDDLIRRGEPHSLEAKLSLLQQTAAGLRFAHENNVVHRDIKPANVRIEPDGRIRIMDFGIAKLLDAETGLTRTGMSIGTAGYLAPEQLLGLKVDHRADIFSFGVLAYELLTGTPPFSGDTVSSLHYQIVNVDPSPVVVADPGCPPLLSACVDRCMEKDRDERYANLEDVQRDLDAVERERLSAGLAKTRAVGVPAEASRIESTPRSGARRLNRAHIALLVAAGIAGAVGVVSLAQSGVFGPGNEGRSGLDNPLGDNTGVATVAADTTDSGNAAADTAAAETNVAGDPWAAGTEAGTTDTPTGDASTATGSVADPTADIATTDDTATATPDNSRVLLLILGGPESGYAAAENIILDALTGAGYVVLDQAGLEMGAGEGVAGADSEQLRQLGRRQGAAVVLLGSLTSDARRSVGTLFTGSAVLSIRAYETATGRLLRTETFQVGAGNVPGKIGATATAAMTDATSQVAHQAARALLRQLSEWILDE